MDPFVWRSARWLIDYSLCLVPVNPRSKRKNKQPKPVSELLIHDRASFHQRTIWNPEAHRAKPLRCFINSMSYSHLEDQGGRFKMPAVDQHDHTRTRTSFISRDALTDEELINELVHRYKKTRISEKVASEEEAEINDISQSISTVDLNDDESAIFNRLHEMFTKKVNIENSKENTEPQRANSESSNETDTPSQEKETAKHRTAEIRKESSKSSPYPFRRPSQRESIKNLFTESPAQTFDPSHSATDRTKSDTFKTASPPSFETAENPATAKTPAPMAYMPRSPPTVDSFLDDTTMNECVTGDNKCRRKTNTPLFTKPNNPLFPKPNDVPSPAPFSVSSPAFNIGATDTKKTFKSTLRRNRKTVSTTTKPAPHVTTETPIRQPLFGKTGAMHTPAPSKSEKSGATPGLTPLGSPMSVDAESINVTFSIGKGDNNRKTPASKRNHSSRRLNSPRTRTPKNTPSRSKIPPPVFEAKTPQPVFEGKEEETTANAAEDQSGLKEFIDSIREDARQLYKDENYKESIHKYSLLLDEYDCPSNIRPVLLANRAAALMMLNAYEAAGYDCVEAIQSMPDDDHSLSSECGPTLMAKLYVRTGRAYVRLGFVHEGLKAYNKAVEIITEALGTIPTFSEEDPNIIHLNHIKIDADSGRSEIIRFNELAQSIEECGIKYPENASLNERKKNLSALSYVNSSLEISPASISLQETKTCILAALNRWRELHLYCESIATETVKFDGVFVKGLEMRNKLKDVPLAVHLKAGMKEPKLSSKAVSEVILRIPVSLQQTYLRALRLEERSHQVHAAASALKEFVSRFLPSKQYEYNWLDQEIAKIDLSNKKKEMADNSFRNGNFKTAVDQYTACFAIDKDGDHSSNKLVGGRLNAVLHCNRAAAYMALSKYREAISDCSAALRIHPQYMKALLRRCRCYVRMKRYDEAQPEYERYVNMVEKARKLDSPDYSFETSACAFDGPSDVRDDDLKAAREELKEMLNAKVNAQKSAAAEKAEKARREWYNSTFGQSSRPKTAEERRNEWYNQQGDNGSRRWDSFNGKGANRKTYSQYSSRSQSRPRPESQRSEMPQEKPDVDPKAKCHYSVLGISRSASEADIKKAYKKCALKYHPDKNKGTETGDIFRRVKEAYDVLKDAERKRNYDRQDRWNRSY